jgi:hypothetical protein
MLKDKRTDFGVRNLHSEEVKMSERANRTEPEVLTRCLGVWGEELEVGL